MNYWLVKTEPSEYAWEDLEREGRCAWNGVRNYQARNFMMKMKKGDRVFIYHSGKIPAVVGEAEVVKEYYPDPEDKRFVLVDLVPLKKFEREIQLFKIKNNPYLKDFILLKQQRLSVMPVSELEREHILKLI